ncbi:hypothetical protein Q31b_56900 [Novipirellula aureliae]|uniref:Uncharacterized protein n=1 Tax=Novipirellula aureliae TaxID=2527966 RepID=A0A5C6D913_9BACT|nr:hypothetical protein [Novipirellula aureliae]TWU33633.1 hypothetical protein Q31b_56900 [Novipirellula aureliae]
MATHEDKYNDPRATITGRGILIGVLVVALAMVGAYFSITQRKTRLVETRAFWGDDVITALQLGERVEVERLDIEPSESEEILRTVELTAMPGLGLLRHLLLESGSYDWTTSAKEPIESRWTSDPANGGGDSLQPIRLRFTDPTAKRFETVEFDINLANGWIGDSAQTKSVRLDGHHAPKLRNFFNTVIHSEQKRYDFRE